MCQTNWLINNNYPISISSTHELDILCDDTRLIIKIKHIKDKNTLQ